VLSHATPPLEMPLAIAGEPVANLVAATTMVQVQSSWFPLYDRNSQTFVPNILDATPADYRQATQRIYHASGKLSFIELPVIQTNTR
jgi:predicted acyl esterase